jgi:putative Holliday junction resolvase
MSRILAIDYGLKRTGLAVTDPLQIIATGLTTVESPKLIAFLKAYFSKEPVELILVGEPKNWDDSDTHATPLVRGLLVRLKKEFPSIPLETTDERYTSKMASRAMIEMGLKRRQRQNKALVDEIAATIMLQEWLERSERGKDR